jgi:hypothetical protein
MEFSYIAFCQVLSDGVTTVFYAFFEGGGYAFTTDPGFATLAGPACQTENLVGIHVTRLAKLAQFVPESRRTR